MGQETNLQAGLAPRGLLLTFICGLVFSTCGATANARSADLLERLRGRTPEAKEIIAEINRSKTARVIVILTNPEEISGQLDAADLDRLADNELVRHIDLSTT